jgi:hypothetical protein
LLIAATGVLIFQIIWQAKLGVYYDWNLFANVGMVLSVWIGVSALHGPLTRLGRTALIVLLVLFAAQSGQWIVGNHRAQTPYVEQAGPP